MHIGRYEASRAANYSEADSPRVRVRWHVVASERAAGLCYAPGPRLASGRPTSSAALRRPRRPQPPFGGWHKAEARGCAVAPRSLVGVSRVGNAWPCETPAIGGFPRDEIPRGWKRAPKSSRIRCPYDSIARDASATCDARFTAVRVGGPVSIRLSRAGRYALGRDERHAPHAPRFRPATAPIRLAAQGARSGVPAC